jgi:hypothetical protein
MSSVASIRRKLQTIDTYARKIIHNENAKSLLQTEWERVFDKDLDDASAKSFVQYYRKMRSRKQRGSSYSLSPAQLDYAMTPGHQIATYGRFPVEIGTDNASIQNLDVYYQNALTKGCGTENSSLTVPVEMGTNQVGGRSRKKNARMNRKKNTRTRGKKQTRKTLRKNRRHRGGDLLASLASRPFGATAPPNVLQTVNNMWSGTTPIPAPSNPVNQTWSYVSNGTNGLINPGLVTPIVSDIVKLANPAPWQTSN